MLCMKYNYEKNEILLHFIFHISTFSNFHINNIVQSVDSLMIICGVAHLCINSFVSKKIFPRHPNESRNFCGEP